MGKGDVDVFTLHLFWLVSVAVNPCVWLLIFLYSLAIQLVKAALKPPSTTLNPNYPCTSVT